MAAEARQLGDPRAPGGGGMAVGYLKSTSPRSPRLWAWGWRYEGRGTWARPRLDQGQGTTSVGIMAFDFSSRGSPGASSSQLKLLLPKLHRADSALRSKAATALVSHTSSPYILLEC